MAPSYLIASLLLSLSFTLRVYGQAATGLPIGTKGQQNICNAIAKFCPGGFPQSPGSSSLPHVSWKPFSRSLIDPSLVQTASTSGAKADLTAHAIPIAAPNLIV